MKAITLLVGIALAATAAGLVLAAAPASAQYGVNLAWDDCGSAGAFDKSFDCASDQGAFNLYGSFVAPHDVDQVVGYTFELGSLYIGALPTPWWDLGAGGCRAGAMSVSAYTQGPGCAALPGNAPFLIAQARIDDTGRLRITGQAGFLEPVNIPGGMEFHAFTLSLRNTRVNTCDGCCAGLCLVLGSVILMQPQSQVGLGEAYEFSWVSWQGGWCGVTGTERASSHLGGCELTPVRPSTWGSLKALYR